MNEILKKNIDVIKEKRGDIKINYDLLDRLNKSEATQEPDSYNGYMLRSNVDQSKAIEVWCEQFGELKYNSIVVVFGSGTLDYFVSFFKKYPNSSIVVYEPCEEIFYNSLVFTDYTELLSNREIVFCVGENKYLSFMNILHNTIGYESVKKPHFAIIPNYHKMFRDEYELFKKSILDSNRTNIIARNATTYFEELSINNYLDNLKKLPYEATVLQLKEAFDKSPQIRDYPAIILSAGPSLDKNIGQIKNLKGRAFVICVDAAFKTATKNGIKPDILVTIDPETEADTFRLEEGIDIPVIVPMTGSFSIRNAIKGRKFYVTDIDYYLIDVLKEFDKSMAALSTAGSVSTTAFSFAREMGFKTIILMGQDLGYPGNKMHAEGVIVDEEDASEEDDRFFYVDGIDGDRVLTSMDMDEFRKWFEEMIELYPDITVVDATEGGALIKGSKIMTLVEATDRYCPKEPLDFEEIIEKSDYLLNDDERVVITEIINKTFDDIDYNIEYFEKAKRDYEKLRTINEKRKYNTQEFKRLIGKVGEYNKYIEENKDFYLYKKYHKQRFYECIDALKEVYDDEYMDIKNAVQQGLKLLDAYIEAGKVLKEKWNRVE